MIIAYLIISIKWRILNSIVFEKVEPKNMPLCTFTEKAVRTVILAGWF